MLLLILCIFAAVQTIHLLLLDFFFLTSSSRLLLVFFFRVTLLSFIKKHRALIFIFCAARREDEKKKKRKEKSCWLLRFDSNKQQKMMMMMITMMGICMHTHASRSYKKADSIFCSFERFRPGRLAFVVGDVPDERSGDRLFLSQSVVSRTCTYLSRRSFPRNRAFYSSPTISLPPRLLYRSRRSFASLEARAFCQLLRYFHRRGIRSSSGAFKSALPLFMLLMFESSSIVIVDAVAGEGGEKCMEAKRTRRNTTRRRKQLKTTFGAFDAIATTTTTSNDYHDCLSLFFSFFSMQRQVPEVPSCAASAVTRKLHRFLRLHLNLFRGRGRGFATKNRLLLPIISGSIFSSIPSIPRNNERN